VGIRYHRASEYVGSSNLPSNVLNFGIRVPSESDRIWPLIWPNLAKIVRIQLELVESGNGDRTLTDSSDGCQIPFFAVRTFFVRAKRRKIFWGNSFFEK
jgi:hypothetical protein